MSAYSQPLNHVLNLSSEDVQEFEKAVVKSGRRRTEDDNQEAHENEEEDEDDGNPKPRRRVRRSFMVL